MAEDSTPRSLYSYPWCATVNGWTADGSMWTDDGYGDTEDEAIADAKRRGGIIEVGDVATFPNNCYRP